MTQIDFLIFTLILGFADKPVLVAPKESQYGGDNKITCDWGANRNDKRVTFIRRGKSWRNTCFIS